FLVAPIDRDEAAEPERALEHQERAQLRLVEDVHVRVEHGEQQRRIDVALMVRAIHRGAIEWKRLRGREAVADPGQQESEPDPDVSEYVQMFLPAEQQGEEHAWRCDDQDVEGNGDVGEERANGRDEHRRIINEKARTLSRPGPFEIRISEFTTR